MTTKQKPDTSAPPEGEGRAGSVVQRALHAIELLAVEPLTAAELARELDVNRSTALRLLSELVATGYVARDPATKRFATVSAKFYGLIQTPDTDWSQILDPVLASIRDEFGDATILAAPAKDTMVYLAFFPTVHMVAVSEQLGTVRPMHCSALGKAYLSALDAETLDVNLARLSYAGGTEHAAKGPIELRRRVEETREVGYAVDRDETFDGVSCIAVPARIRGSLIGAVGISGPSSRLPDSRIEELGQYLIKRISGL
ncbi:IclR family transcriptional regulator [Actinoallomurus sp. NBC_01490]|uniref:IclR family transcriptional regulator n=1 Tax=Actinoallomurus sp. NBC_01490 TaxID=2903557 RepID=UPI002E37BC6F|nr:IclR family transcriptional regulator [Actinoallomurus sp. NBC_01490]